MMRTRFLSCTFAVSVVALAFAAAASAAQTTVGYSLTPGKCTKPIAVPANNKPVQMMGTQFVYPVSGMGQVVLLRTTGSNQVLQWAGVDFAHGLEQSYNDVAGWRIMALDYYGQVEVQTAASAHVQVCSTADNPHSPSAGYLTFTY